MPEGLDTFLKEGGLARISDIELERLKREVSLERLVEAKGIKLERRGPDNFVGRCLFHSPDETPTTAALARSSASRTRAHSSGGNRSMPVSPRVTRRSATCWRPADGR